MDEQQIPFVRQLASSDRQARDKAVESLRSYLLSNHSFDELELRKLWKGLFFAMWHSDRPLAQQRLATNLAGLLSPLPPSLFSPFVAAFWFTLASQYALIDSLRLNKFLLLARLYVKGAFSYISNQSWNETMLFEYLGIIKDLLLENQGKVSDGLRYHILDVWIEELKKVNGYERSPVEIIIGPMEQLKAEGRTKTMRKRAADCVDGSKFWVSDRIETQGLDKNAGDDRNPVDEDWEGFE